MDREATRQVLRQVRQAIVDVDPAELFSGRDAPPATEYDDLAYRALRVIVDGGTAKEATRAVEQHLQDEWGIGLGLIRRGLLTRRFARIGRT